MNSEYAPSSGEDSDPEFDAPPDLPSLSHEITGEGVQSPMPSFETSPVQGVSVPEFQTVEGGSLPDASASLTASEAPEIPGFAPPSLSPFPDIPEPPGPSLPSPESPELAPSPLPSAAQVDSAPRGEDSMSIIAEKLDRLIDAMGEGKKEPQRFTPAERQTSRWSARANR